MNSSELPQETPTNPEKLSAKDAFFKAYNLPTDSEHMEILEDTQIGDRPRNIFALFMATKPNGESKYYFVFGERNHGSLGQTAYEAVVRDRLINKDEMPFLKLMADYVAGKDIPVKVLRGTFSGKNGFTVDSSAIPGIPATPEESTEE